MWNEVLIYQTKDYEEPTPDKKTKTSEAKAPLPSPAIPMPSSTTTRMEPPRSAASMAQPLDLDQIPVPALGYMTQEEIFAVQDAALRKISDTDDEEMIESLFCAWCETTPLKLTSGPTTDQIMMWERQVPDVCCSGGTPGLSQVLAPRPTDSADGPVHEISD